MSNIKELQKEIHANAVDKGFWEGEANNIPTKLMLIVSEISEALEAHRKDKRFTDDIGAINGWILKGDFVTHFEIACKDTFEDELADAVIRILDLAGGLNIDLEGHIKAKMRYNATRPHKHGVKY